MQWHFIIIQISSTDFHRKYFLIIIKLYHNLKDYVFWKNSKWDFNLKSIVFLISMVYLSIFILIKVCITNMDIDN